MKIPRLLIAGTHSGVGKTTVMIGLMQAFAQKGITVQPFKSGPDYIDPGYHTYVSDRPCRNLDPWLVPSHRLASLFVRSAQGAKLALIEGMMGLYDGIGALGEEGSTAQLAKQLRCPVLLVLDGSSLSRSAAAVVRGYLQFDRQVKIVGCFLNRMSGPGHFRLVKEGIEKLTGIPVLGYLPQDERLKLPERHLGLIPSYENLGWKRILAPLSARIREGADFNRIQRLAHRVEEWPLIAVRAERRVKPFRHRVPIGIAMDEAFHFYYPENLELLEEFGGEWVPFSPLHDSTLPDGVAAFYLGGGFPEVYAPALARNQGLFRQIRKTAAAGSPIYAECGGLMFLSRSITDSHGRRHPMVGLIPGEVRMTDRLQHFGYKRLRAVRPNLLARAGEEARGHEFHHSVCYGIPAKRKGAYEATSAVGEARRIEGYAHRNLLASYIHLHFLSRPRWAERFVQAARYWQTTQKMGSMVMAAFLSLLVHFHTSPVIAAEEPIRLEEVIVTAAKAKTPAKRVTRAVSVIPEEQLSVEKGEFVSDALSDVPGILVRRTGSIGRTTAVVIRGANATQVHVTMDGAHVASPTLGSFDFNHVTPDNLERMEVLRGPGSTLYGSDAMGGVINLVTRRGKGPMTYAYTQEFGGQNTWREGGSLQGQIEKWHLSGSASRLDSDGLSQNGDYENVNLSTRIGYDFAEETTLDFSLRHIFAIVGIDDGPFRPDPNRRDRERQTIATATLEAPITSWWSQRWRISTSIGNLIDNDPSNGGTEADSLSKLDTERYGAEWMNRFSLAKWDTLTVGFEFEDREADRRTGGANQNFSKAQTTRSVYLQNQWNPWDPLTVVTGARFFRESAFGSDEVFDASAAYFLAPWNLKLRGGWAEGFRVPSLNELFFPNFGVPTLGPERSETFEVGVDQVLFEDKVHWSETLFRTNYRDLIQIVRLTPTSSQPQNVGRSRIDGSELELELKPWDPWVLRGSYTHLEANERPSQEELLRVPKNTIGFSVGLVPSKKWEAQLQGLLVSSREESTGTNSRNKTKGYLKFDLFTQYRFTSWMKGYMRIENLTDRRYSEILGFPAAGTVASVGVTVEQ